MIGRNATQQLQDLTHQDSIASFVRQLRLEAYISQNFLVDVNFVRPLHSGMFQSRITRLKHYEKEVARAM